MTLFLCIIYFILIFGCGIGVLRYEALIVLIVELLVTNIAMREQRIEFAYMVIALDVNQVRTVLFSCSWYGQKGCHQWWKHFSFIISQTFDIVIYDICCEKRSKTKPVCFCGIKEPIKRLFWKPFLKRTSPLLHIHASSDKNVAEFVTKQRNRRNTFFFQSITSGENLPDMMFGKNSEHSQYRVKFLSVE